MAVDNLVNRICDELLNSLANTALGDLVILAMIEYLAEDLSCEAHTNRLLRVIAGIRSEILYLEAGKNE